MKDASFGEKGGRQEGWRERGAGSRARRAADPKATVPGGAGRGKQKDVEGKSTRRDGSEPQGDLLPFFFYPPRLGF